MTINYSKQVLLKRGNTAVSSTYVGPLGEVTYDTDLHQIRVHDGERAGGWIVPGGPEYDLLVPLIGNAATQQTQINSLFANANVQQAFMESIVNQGNVDPGTGNETFWFNTEDGRLYIKQANVWVDSSPIELPNPSYVAGIMSDFAGNIVPAANVTYSLGTQEAQWKDLWVSNNTIYIGNTPITVSNGSLLVGGNVISGGGSSDTGDFVFSDNFLTVSAGNQVVIQGESDGNARIDIPNDDWADNAKALTISNRGAQGVKISTGQNNDYTWLFGNVGNLTLPAGGILGDTFGDGGLTLQSPEGTYSQLSTFDGNAYIWAADAGYNGVNSESAVYIATRYNTESENRWIFGADGNLTLPQGGTITEGGGLTGAIRLTPAGGANAEQALLIYPTAGGDGDHIHLTAGGGSTELYLGNDFHYVKLVDGGNVEIRTNDILGNTGTWNFGTDGATTFPGGMTIQPIPMSTGTIITQSNAQISLVTTGNDAITAIGWSEAATGGNTAIASFNETTNAITLITGNTETALNGWTFAADGTLTLPNKLWARASDNGSIAFTNDGTTERGYLKVDAGYNMVVNAESNYYVKRNGTDRLAIESNYTTIRSGTATRIETNLVGTSRTYTFGETGVLGLPYDSYLESTSARNLNLGAWGNISIIADAQSNSTTSWIFGADGDLTLPGNIKGATGTGPVTVTSNDGATDYNWTFGTDGKLTAPGKIQTSDTTNSISTTTGALIVGGGAGIQSDVHIGGTLNITDTTPSNDYTTGALVVNGGVGVNGNINLTGNINILNGNINIQEFTGSTGNFYGDIVTGFNAFYAGKTGFTALPYTVAQFSTASNTYSQINMENTSTGKLASADFVGTADIGTDSSWFFDIGIANSGYDPVLAAENNAPGTSVGPLDTYFYVQGNVDVPNTGGNLTIGTSQIGKVVKFIAGGTNTANVIMTVTETGVVVTKNLTAPNMAYAADVAAANAAIVTANTAMKSYVDSRPAGSTYSNANVASYLVASSQIIGNASITGTTTFGTALQIIGSTNTITTTNGSAVQFGQRANFNSINGVFSNGPFVAQSGTASTSTDTGAVRVSGGVGVSGNIYAGGNVTAPYFVGNAVGTTATYSGNVRANKFVGDGSLLTNVTVNAAGNIQGTGTNINLVAGSYTAIFDNTGLFTLPAMGGDEGGEINLGIPTTNTTLQNRVAIDVFQNRLRFFEGSVDAKGAYLDLSQAAAGVGTLLNNRISGFVNAGSFVTMDNIKATVTTGGNRGLSLATVSGSFTYNIAATYALGNSSTGGAVLVGQTLTTSATTSIFGWNFGNTGEMQTYIITNTSSLLTYRITVMIGASYNNNMISIERLI
jgi:hypothetical protein